MKIEKILIFLFNSTTFQKAAFQFTPRPIVEICAFSQSIVIDLQKVVAVFTFKLKPKYLKQNM